MPTAEVILLTALALAGYLLAGPVWAAAAKRLAGAAAARTALLAVALGLNIAALILRIARGHAPAASAYDTFAVLALIAAAAAVYFRAVGSLPLVSAVLLPAAAAMGALALALSATAYRQFARDFWAVLHVVLSTGTLVVFAVAAVGGWLLLHKHRQLRRHDPAVFRAKLPSLERLDRFLRQVLPLGWVLVTATIAAGVAGAFQPARSGYFRNWLTHPKMLVAGITWLLYTLALHAACARRFRGRTAAMLALLGFTLLLVVLVASMLIPGH